MKNKKTFYAVLSIAILAIFFGVVLITQAQSTGTNGDLVPCAGQACTWCDVFKLLQNVFNMAALLLTPIVIIFIVYGGVLYIIGATAGSDKQIGRAKDIVSDAITGLIIVLLSFIIVNATIVGLTKSRIEDFLNIQCSQLNLPETPAPSAVPTTPPPDTNPVPPGSGDIGTVGSDEYTAEEARKLIAAAGVKINHTNECPAGTPYQNVPGGCTSLNGINKETLDGAIALAKACGCAVTITGGSELGHGTGSESHGSGDKIDIDDSKGVTDYIEKNYGPPIGNRTSDNAPIYYDGNGNYYALEPPRGKEGAHWDICYDCKQPPLKPVVTPQ